MNRRHSSCSRIQLAVRVVDCILLLALANCNIPDVLAAEDTPGDANRDAARQHYSRGLELAQQGNVSQALLEFQEAYRNQPHFAVLYNIGQAYIALQQPIEALLALEQYLAEGREQIPEERAQATVAQIIAVRAQTAEVMLTVRPAGASVTVDGKVIGESPIHDPTRVAAGRHLISARASDGTEVAREITPQGGERVTLSMEIPSGATTIKTPHGNNARASAAQAATYSIVATARPTSHDSPSPNSSIRVSTLGYVMGTVGVVLGAGAAGHYLWNRNRYEQWQSVHSDLANNQQASDYVARQIQNNELAGSIQSASQVTVGLVVASGALLATGVTLVLVDRSKRPTITTETQSHGGQVISLRASW